MLFGVLDATTGVTVQLDVPAQRCGLAKGALSQRLLQALVRLFYAQPTVTRGYPKQLRDPVPIRARRAQLAERDRITTAPRRRHLTLSWDTLQGVTAHLDHADVRPQPADAQGPHPPRRETHDVRPLTGMTGRPARLGPASPVHLPLITIFRYGAHSHRDRVSSRAYRRSGAAVKRCDVTVRDRYHDLPIVRDGRR
jgi:hypothetical protein